MTNTTPNYGVPAFPIHAGCVIGGVASGMSLRDWFAGMALQGILSANAQAMDEVTDKNVDYVIARKAYASADAMLAKRERKQP